MDHKRNRYQHGSLTTEEAKERSAVWVYRWTDGAKRRKQILGTFEELNRVRQTKQAAEYRQQANASQSVAALNPSLTVAALVEDYKKRELERTLAERRSLAKLTSISSPTTSYPKWGSLPLGGVKAVAVEDWLKTVTLANGSKAKIREVFGAAFRHAMRHELFPNNPIANVRQARKRALEPQRFFRACRNLSDPRGVGRRRASADGVSHRRGDGHETREVLVSSGVT